jgi:hypothetical protein
MTTPRDLLIVAMDVESSRPVERGELSLVLAGAELIDLLGVQAIGLDDGRIVPSARSATGDRLLDEAASSLVRQEPYESVDDWLWRRGRGLSSLYVAALQAEGQLTRQRRRWLPLRTSRMVLADSPARHEAVNRWTSDEPVLAALAAAVGIDDQRTAEFTNMADAEVEVEIVLAAVNTAVTELEAVRQRRSVEEAAFDNIWRGG